MPDSPTFRNSIVGQITLWAISRDILRGSKKKFSCIQQRYVNSYKKLFQYTKQGKLYRYVPRKIMADLFSFREL
jgi:hypothetical protein